MRLLNTPNLDLHYIIGEILPVPFSPILGATKKEWNARDIDPPLRPKDGFQKVESFRRMAAAAGYEYAWADINKINSSELSESINSMFRWRFVYLSDVSDPTIAPDSEFLRKSMVHQGLDPARAHRS